MPTEFRTMYCPQCHEDVQARRDEPGLGALGWGTGASLWILAGWLVGKGSSWECSQCSGPIPLDPEEKHRQIATAVFVMLPILAVVVLVLVLLVMRVIGGK